jgi:hypothetical protein
MDVVADFRTTGLLHSHASPVFVYASQLSLILLMVTLTSIDGYAHGGIGIHIWNITPHMFLQFQKVIPASSVTYSF